MRKYFMLPEPAAFCCLAVFVFGSSTLHAQQSLAKPSQWMSAPWPPPAGELRVIIDTDAANEVDDQWAIALALGFPERHKIEGFVSAHYGQRGGSKRIAKSRASLEETLQAAGMSGKFAIKNGSDPFVYRDRFPKSEGVDFIECERRVSGIGSLGKFLHDIRKQSAYAMGADKGMFDLGDIAALIDPAGTGQWVSAAAPAVAFDYRYDLTQNYGPLLRIPSIDRSASFALLDQSLARIAKSSSPSVGNLRDRGHDPVYCFVKPERANATVPLDAWRNQ